MPSTSPQNAPQATLEVKTSISTTRWINALHQCENPDNIPWIIDSNGLRSYGKYQWQMRSWLNYKKQGATEENIGDPVMQDKITRYVLDTKGSGDWYNCSKKLGAYPIDK